MMDGVMYIYETSNDTWTWQLHIYPLNVQVTSNYECRKNRLAAVRRAIAVAKRLGVAVKYRYIKGQDDG